MVKAITNGKIITEQEILQDYVLVFDNNVIDIVSETELNRYSINECIDAAGSYISPGFIDIHIHGCCGFDTMDDDSNALAQISKGLLKTGVTSFLPTSMTMDFDKIEKTLKRIRVAMSEHSGAEIMGCHMEGPFISEIYAGAQDKRHILLPDFSMLQKYLDVIKVITLAPELVTDDTFIQSCVASGIVVSCGHSNATYEQALAAIAAGVTHVTHMFNALAPLHHRRPGVIGAALDTHVDCELIADNFHVHPAVQRLLLRVKGLDKIILITDAMRASMLGDGNYEFGGQNVIVSNGQARLADGVIAGSILSLNQAVKNVMDTIGIDLVKAIRLVSVNPARKLGVFHKKGSIRIGKQADIAVFDDDLEVSATFVRGNLLYRRQ
ncbi:MAG: N-acetylglucosamine-6-phosphate deacetylase [Firmicutes bacterium]|nr:N-acetylglucosamine-6-phosphate deacetylase [Bacillota bacterium]